MNVYVPKHKAGRTREKMAETFISYMCNIENTTIFRLEFKKFVRKFISIDRHDVISFRDYKSIITSYLFLNVLLQLCRGPDRLKLD